MTRFKLVVREKVLEGEHDYGSEVAAAFGNDREAVFSPKRKTPHSVEPPRPIKAK